MCWASFFALTRRLQCRWASFFALTPTSGRAGRRMSRTKRGNMATLKPASPLRPKTALKTPISHPQRRWRFQTTGPPGRQSQAEAPAGPEAMSSPAISHLVPFTRTWARWHARGQRRPRAYLGVDVRIKGLTRMFRGLRANNTPRQAPLCPKRRPPRPQPPVFTGFRRGGLHFGRHTAARRGLAVTERGKCVIRDPTRRRHADS